MKNNPLLLIILVAAVFLIGFPVAYYSNAETIQIEVTGNERINTGHSGYYLVYTASNETFKNVDNMWYLKWNSSDVQGQLRPSKAVVYKVKVNGFRIPFFSMYRNIISVKEVIPVSNSN